MKLDDIEKIRQAVIEEMEGGPSLNLLLQKRQEPEEDQEGKSKIIQNKVEEKSEEKIV